MAYCVINSGMILCFKFHVVVVCNILSNEKCLNELYRLTSCKNFLKESLGAKDFTGY